MSGIYVCGATAFLIVFGSCLNDFRTIWAGGVCVCGDDVDDGVCP